MEFDRRVQIRVALRGEDGKGFGTGYLVAPRLVLTADHVLDELDPDGGRSAVTVCRPDDGEQEYPARVLWRRRDDEVDAALVGIDADCHWPVSESLSDLIARPPQRYGHLIGNRSHPVSLTGFPRLQKDAERGRLDEHLEGRITPGTGALAGRYEVTSTTPVPAGPPAPGGTRWSGISGAAVLADDGQGGDLLCGIVRHDRRADGGTRLTATPLHHLLTDHHGRPSDFRRLVAQHTGWDPVLEPVEPAPLLKPATADRDLHSPAALLRADTEAVAFHGRDHELADLHTWCTADPAGIAIRGITGPGGQGKTRLARHLTDTLSHQGWVTGHLRSDLTDHDTPPDLATLSTALPLLLVVDYAETRPRLLRRLVTHLHTTRHRVRLLLLARSDGEWRTDALSASASVRRLLAAAPVVPLGPLQPAAATTRERGEAFRDAARDLALLLPRVPSVPGHDWTALAGTLRPADDLAHPRYDNALTLQMTALVALLQQGPRPVTTAPGDPAEKVLLEHEERFWKDSADSDAFELGLDTATLKAAVAVAALCGADSTAAATRVLATLPAVPATRTARTAAWLAHLYPADPDRYWGTLQPDRIAEHHAADVLMKGGIDLPALLTAADHGQQAQSVTVLARAAIAHYNATHTTDTDHLLHTLDAALDTAPLAYQATRIATAALPYPSRLVAPLALRLTAALAWANKQLAAVEPAFEPGLAASLTNLGNRLSEVGRRGEALTATKEAMGIYRRLAQADPAAFEPDLAGALTNLGNRLSEAGRRGEALTAEQEAVEIRRRLATDNPAAFEPDLAGSLTNLGIQLSEAGRRGEALTATEEAMGIYRRLAQADPAAFEPNLATSLSNLGIRLSEVGRRGEALTAEQETVGICLRLAADNPAAFEPDLAGALTNLGNQLSEAGRQGEALTATEQAVEIRRRLATDNPAAFEPDLSTSLSNLGNRLSQAGRCGEALTATEQAVEIRRRLAADNPAAFEPDLSTSLSNLGIRLSEVGRRGEALTATEEAVEIRRRLAADNPAAFEPDLAGALTNLGNRLSEAGRRGEALTATEQAVEIRRRLATDNPAAFEPDLAGALTNLGNRLSEAGRRGEALTATEQAVEIRRRLVQADPAAFEPDLAGALTNLGIRLSEAGRQGEALTATEEAMGIYRRLAQADPAAFEPNLATSLSNLGIQMSEEGRQGEALTATEEAMGIYRRLAQADPAAFEPNLATSLSNLGIRLSEVGRRGEALAATEEAVEIRRRLVQADPAAFEPDLATSLSNLGIWLSEVGRRGEALAATEEAVEIRRRLATDNPAAFEPDLATSLSNLGIQLSEAGRQGEALTATEQAVGIYRRLAADNPAAFEPDLATSLTVWAIVLATGGGLAAALSLTGEAVECYRHHIAEMPFLLPQLHTVLNLQAYVLDDLGRPQDAAMVRRWLAENPLPPGSHN
ncbi:tetratricopeptide repeat-containing serine protease family protein [Kitasatospora purpeofusca]|uniref:tetratricopeptide repeat-containing serine protease family protein n=1 Tax=Kitasatospora purpeofusca TaxID=67352 RepID=UPI0030F01DEA